MPRFPAFMLVLAAFPLAAQSLGVQVRAALPVGGFEDTERIGPHVNTTCFDVARAQSRRYSIGGGGQVRIQSRFFLELDAIYRRIHSTGQTCGIGPGEPVGFSSAGSAWEFPVLLKYSFREGPVAPFLAGGPAIRRTTFSVTGTSSAPGLGSYTRNYADVNAQPGVTLGGGIDFRYKGLRISPEVRWSRYGALPCEVCAIIPPASLAINPLEIALGIGF